MKHYGVDLFKPFCLAYKKEFGTSPQNVFRGLAQGSCTQNKNFSDFYSQTLMLAPIEYQGGCSVGDARNWFGIADTTPIGSWL